MNTESGYPSEPFGLVVSSPNMPTRPPEFETRPHAPSLIGMLLPRWLTLVVVTLCAALISVAGIWYFIEPKYKVVATLHVSPVVRAILDSDSKAAKWGDYRQYVGTQALTITGAAIIDRLLSKPEIRELPSLAKLQNPVGYIKSRIVAGQIPSSELLEVSMVDEHPHDMVAIVNGLVATYLQDIEEKEREWDQKVVSSLKIEQDELMMKLQIKNEQLQQVAVEQGASGAQDSGQLIDKWLSDAHQSLTQANKEKALAEAKLARLANEDPKNADPMAFEEFVGRDPELLALKEQYRQQKAAAAADTTQGRGPMHPDVRSRPQVVAELEERMRKREDVLVEAFATAQRRELDAAFRDSEITARVLESELKKLQTDRASVAGSQFILSDRRREREQIERALEQVRDKIWTIEVEQKSASQITAHALAQVPPSPNFDKRPKMAAIAVMLSMALGVGVALLRGVMDRSFHNPVEVAGSLGVRVLGSVENVRAEGVALGLDARMVEPIRGISTTLLAASPQGAAHSRMITSPTAGSGKSSMSMNLARSLAATGRRVLLVDGDNQGQGATRRLGLAGRLGVPEYLDGMDASGLIHTISRNFDFLPAGPKNAMFGDVLRAKGTAGRLYELFKNYEEIIVDSPPLLIKSDAIALATMVDEVVLVLRAGRTTQEEARLARQSLDSVRSNVVGVILNAVDPKAARYGYGYSYTYANGENG